MSNGKVKRRTSGPMSGPGIAAFGACSTPFTLRRTSVPATRRTDGDGEGVVETVTDGDADGTTVADELGPVRTSPRAPQETKRTAASKRRDTPIASHAGWRVQAATRAGVPSAACPQNPTSRDLESDGALGERSRY